MFADELGVVLAGLRMRSAIPAAVFTLEGFVTWSSRDRSPCEPAEFVFLRLLRGLAYIRIWKVLICNISQDTGYPV